MAHQSLYRAYRPQTFTDVAGQSHIVSALTEQLKADKVAHAYLFAGSRGLGKTSVARIFAKELGVSDKDLYEIDAASHNTVDDIRALTENIYTHPFESPKKLYLLDEAHMLSKSAWNAFLKTLEEPPTYAVFILATTELSKVPDTVQSRCQVFEFRKPTREVLMEVVSDVSKKEGYTLGSGVPELITLLADGSYRDALSILEKVFSVSKDKKISREEAELATGAPKTELVHGFVEALGKKNAGEACSIVHKASKESVDMHLFLTIVLERVRSILLIRHAPELHKELEGELGEDYERLEVLARDTNSGISHATLARLLDALSRQRYSPVAALPLELAVMELYAA